MQALRGVALHLLHAQLPGAATSRPLGSNQPCVLEGECRLLSAAPQRRRGDLSTFCLQQPRQNPEPGQQYTLADSRSLTLVGSNAKGETVRLPAAPYMSFVSDRGFT